MPRRIICLLALVMSSLSLHLVAQSQKPDAKTLGRLCKLVPVNKPKPKMPKDISGLRSGPTIKYLVSPYGFVSKATLTKSSGNKNVDLAYLDAVQKSSFKPLDPACGGIESTITFLIHFDRKE